MSPSPESSSGPKILETWVNFNAGALNRLRAPSEFSDLVQRLNDALERQVNGHIEAGGPRARQARYDRRSEELGSLLLRLVRIAGDLECRSCLIAIHDSMQHNSRVIPFDEVFHRPPSARDIHRLRSLEQAGLVSFGRNGQGIRLGLTERGRVVAMAIKGGDKVGIMGVFDPTLKVPEESRAGNGKTRRLRSGPPPATPPRKAQGPQPDLSPREKQVLKLISASPTGLTSSEIHAMRRTNRLDVVLTMLLRAGRIEKINGQGGARYTVLPELVE